MKKVLVTLSIMFVSVALFAQNASQQKKAEDFIKFKELTHNFGKIKQGTPVTYEFVFTNVSDQPIVIESAIPACGCTVPSYPQGAIAKNKSEKITAIFNAATLGPFNKAITIKLAGVDMPLQLSVTGEVLTAEDYAKHAASKKNGSK